MNSKYVLPNGFKYMLSLNVLIMLFGFIGNNDTAIASAAVIFVILSVSIEILEKIHQIPCKE